ncbi:MAG: hypothetical protein HYV07_13685 [Deltaproteobacteria bacterium]|nr:hypothetical protein [Deltaproteobacteria bacterium]
MSAGRITGWNRMAAAALVALPWSCRPGATVSFDFGGDKILLVAERDSDRGFRTTSIVTQDAGRYDVPLESGSALVFALASNAVLGPAGPLDPSELTLEKASSQGGCARCTLPGATDTILLEGDRCLIPSQARAFVLTVDGSQGELHEADPEQSNASRSALRLGRVGPCTYEALAPIVPPARATITLSPIVGDAPVELPSAYATARDGTLGLFGQAFVRIVRPDGRVSDNSDPGFVDVVIEAIGFEDGFVVLSRSVRDKEAPDRPSRVRFHWVALDATVVEMRAPTSIDVIPAARTIHELPTLGPLADLGPHVVGLSGKSRTNGYSHLIACKLDPPELGPCRDVAADLTMFGTISSVAWDNDGALFVARSVPPGVVAIGAVRGAAHEWVETLVPGAAEKLTAVRVVGSRIFACGKDETGHGGVWTTSSSAATNWSRIVESELAGGLLSEEVDGTLFAVFSGGQVFELNADTEVATRSSLPTLLPDRHLVEARAIGADLLLEDECGSLWRRQGSRLVKVFGDADSSSCLTVVADGPDGRAHGFGRRRHSVLDGAAWIDLSDAMPDARPLHAALDPSDGSMLLGYAANLSRLSAGTVEVIMDDLPAPPLLATSDHGVFAVTSGGLSVVRGGSIESIPTPDCILTAVEARGLVAFAGGSGCLLRIVWVADQPRVERIPWANDVGAIELIRPDHLLLETSDEVAFELKVSSDGSGFDAKDLEAQVGKATSILGRGDLWLRLKGDELEDPGQLTVLGARDRVSVPGLSGWDRAEGGSVRILVNGRLIGTSLGAR